MIYKINSIYDVYIDRNEVHHGKKILSIPPKQMDVLSALLNASPNCVTREQLFEDIWEGTFVVEEALTRVISELRKVFSESPDFIKTVHKKGYRCDGQIEKLDGAEHQKYVKMKTRNWLLSALVTSILLVFAFTNLEKNALTHSDILELSSRFEDEQSASLSDDNHFVLSVLNNKIRIKDLRDETATFLNTAGVVSQVQWSQNDIIYLTQDQTYQIRKVQQNGNNDHLIFSSQIPIKGFKYTHVNVYALKENEGYTIISTIEQFQERELYKTQEDIKSFRVKSGVKYTLERNLNKFQIKDILSGEIKYQTYDEVFDFEIISNNELILAKSSQLCRIDLVTGNETALLNNVTISKMNLNAQSVLTFTNEIPSANLFLDETMVYSTKRHEFFPVENSEQNELVFISTRCGFYNIWKANLETTEVERLTFYKYGYIDHFALNEKKGDIYFLHHVKEKTFLNKIDQNELHHIQSIDVQDRVKKIVCINGILYSDLGDSLQEIEIKESVLSFGLIKSKKHEESISRFRSKYTTTNNDVYGIDLSSVL